MKIAFYTPQDAPKFSQRGGEEESDFQASASGTRNKCIDFRPTQRRQKRAKITGAHGRNAEDDAGKGHGAGAEKNGEETQTTC